MHKLLLKRSNRTLRRNETVNDALATLTHIHMQDLKLTELKDLDLFFSAVCLYCYDNEITSLKGIENLTKLEELQAQNNQITEIPPLGPFQLVKCDLRNNCISEIKGFENQHFIFELFLSKQRVPEVILTPHCFESLFESLEVLEMSECGLKSLEEFHCLPHLRVLNLAGNKLDSLPELQVLLSKLVELESLDLRGNPFCSEVKYREHVIVMGMFHELDAKEIPDTQRETLLRMMTRKIAKPKKPKKEQPVQNFLVKHLK